MPIKYEINKTVVFTECTAIPKEQSENTLFGILQENAKDNDTYFRELINETLKLPYTKLPDSFLKDCQLLWSNYPL